MSDREDVLLNLCDSCSDDEDDCDNCEFTDQSILVDSDWEDAIDDSCNDE